MSKKRAYMAAGGFAAFVIVLSLVINPQAAGAAITGAFALIGTVLAGLAGILG